MKILVVTFLTLSLIMGGVARAGAPFIEVSAQDQTTVTPNILEVAITLSEEPSKGKITLAELDSRLAKSLKAAGVNAKKQLSVESRSVGVNKRDDGYSASNYLLKLSSVEQFNAVFEQFATNGINDAVLRRTGYDSLEQVNLELLASALLKARKSAEHMAQTLGQSIGSAVQITAHTGGDSAYDYTPALYGAKRSGMVGNSAPQLPQDLEIKPIRISRSVTVRFELK